MVTQLEYEMKQSTMLRAISLDIKRDYENIIYKLYDDEYKGERDDSTSEWAMIISDLFVTADIANYTAIINRASEKKINLWDWKPWTDLMKVELPVQFRKRINEFTQVPKLAAMGTPPKRIVKKTYDDW